MSLQSKKIYLTAIRLAVTGLPFIAMLGGVTKANALPTSISTVLSEIKQKQAIKNENIVNTITQSIEQRDDVIIDTDPLPKDEKKSRDERPTDVVIEDDSRTSPRDETVATDEPRFSCKYVDNKYTVMYNPEAQSGQGYAWAVPQKLGGGWTAQRRCQEISRRLEEYRPDGLLELRTAVENNYNTICATTQKQPSCRIVLTVPPGKDPVLVRDQVFENIVLADSGEYTEGVNTFTSNNQNNQILNQIGNILNVDLSNSSSNTIKSNKNGINLRPFLAVSDGGTGQKLNRLNRVNKQNSPVLNPENFR